MSSTGKDTGRPPERSESELGWPDVFAVVTLVLVAVIIALPALRAELLANSDNSVHLAEIRDLARSGANGWSELGFCGFPLGMLQPPLTFGGLALLTRWGVPLEPLYQLVMIASLFAPSLAFYSVARKRLNAGLALGLAVTLPLYRSSISGEASAFSGMFSFYFAAAAVILIADVLVREKRGLNEFVLVAALAGFVGASHMYVTIALVYLGLVHTAWSLRRRELARRLYYDLPALTLGALAAASYWLPNLLAQTPTSRPADPIARVVIRFFTASAHSAVKSSVGFLGRLAQDPVLHLDSLIQVLALLVVLLGLRHVRRAKDDLPRYGLMLAAVLIFAMILRPLTGPALLGPTGTRLLFVAKMGLLASTFPFLSTLTGRVARANLLAAASAVSLLLAFVSQRVVAQEILPSGSVDLAEIRQLWTWIRGHRDESWGRIYVQDTFGSTIGNALDHSHLLVRTAELTGSEQVGAYYGLTPYAKEWLAIDLHEPASFARAIPALDRANVTHLLVVNDAELELGGEPLKLLARFGRYSLLERTDTRSNWARVLGGAGEVSVRRDAPGRLLLSTTPAVRELAVSESYHPFWRAEPPESANVRADAFGLMQIERQGAGGSTELVFDPPRFPNYLAAAAALLILSLAGSQAILRQRAQKISLSNA